MNRKNQMNTDAVLLGSVVFILLIQNFLAAFIGPFQYFDELYAASFFLFFFLLLTHLNFRLEIKRSTLIIVVLLFLFSVCGFMGVYRFHYQPTRIAILDWFLHMKFFLAIGTTYSLFYNRNMQNMYIEFWRILRILIAGLFLLMLADYALDIFPARVRFGLRAESLFFGTPANMTFVMIALTALLFRLYEFYRGKILLYMIMVWILTLSTLRVKAFASVVVSFFIYFIIIRKRRKFGFLSWLMMASGVLLIAARQLATYYINNADKEVRSVLQRFSFRIANDYFPFGTGFGTYASAYSADPYSRVYIQYHLDRIWGMSREYHSFISDTFWPMIIGQSGYLGLCIYFILILILVLSALKVSKNNAYSYASILLIVIFLFIASTSESAFVNTYAIILAVPIGLAFAENANYCKTIRKGVEKEI